MAAILILTTMPDLKTAKAAARSLVAARLAACVSTREGWESYYRWKGRTERARETLVLIKTLRKKFDAVKKFLKKIHPYEVPEIISVPVSRGSVEYLSWLRQSVK